MASRQTAGKTVATDNPHECPECGSWENRVTRDGGAADGTERQCNDCGTEWRTEYEFVGATVLD